MGLRRKEQEVVEGTELVVPAVAVVVVAAWTVKDRSFDRSNCLRHVVEGTWEAAGKTAASEKKVAW